MPRMLRALLLLLAASAAYAEPLTLTMPRVANTFFVDEDVQMSVCGEGLVRPVLYSVIDYWSVRRAQGQLTVGNGQPVMLTLGRKLGMGFYRIIFFDGRVQNRLEDNFCVIPRPYDRPGDYSLFGLHPPEGSTDEGLAAASQMGVRVVRLDLSWPPLEPQRGAWNMAPLQNCLTLAKKHGMQALFVLGYTPQWSGEKPVNYLDDWVNAAWFTWHPTDPNDFAKYLDQVTEGLRGQTVTWPSALVQPPGQLQPTQTLPVTHSFEMWNEVDMMFYVGDWGRYTDLLRMGWAAGRRAMPDTPMIYGGSTGNFIAMGMLASTSTRYSFDYLSLHPGGDMEQALRVWYSGAQQIPWVVGAPRETMHTESYAQGRRGTVGLEQYQETPAELRRCYLTLKAWREAGFFRSGCLGGWIRHPGSMALGTSLLVPHGDHLCPTPLYPAFAITRWLLSDATEVGPVALGANITAHVFLKHGKVMLAAWSDENATASIALGERAVEVDVLGGNHYFRGQRTLQRRLGSNPMVIIGAEARVYLGQALRNRYRLLSETPYGTPQTNTDNGAWYARPLTDDLTFLLSERLPRRLQSAVHEAAEALGSSAVRGPQSLLVTENVCWAVMQQVVAACPAGQELPPRAADALWRLVRMEEWLGEVLDDRSGVWNAFGVAEAEISAVENRLQEARRRLARVGGDGDLPCAQQMLDRAQRQLARLRQVKRRGTYQAVLHKVMLAELLSSVEKPVVLRVVPILDFATSRCFRKSRLLEPGRQHTLKVWVYNYLNHAVSGNLSLTLPPTWSPDQPTVRFTAAAGQPSEATAVEVTLPGDPTPWSTLASFTLDGNVNLSLPASLNDHPLLEINGTLDGGGELSMMGYYVNVGRWMDDPLVTAGPTPARETQVKLRAVRQQMTRALSKGDRSAATPMDRRPLLESD